MESRQLAARIATACLLALTVPAGLRSQDAVAGTRQGLEMLNQGRYREAEQLLLQALKAAGPANVTAVYNLASLYQRQGRFQEAERLHRLALERMERARGPFDPGVAQSLSDLGALYRSLGRYSQALAVLERAVQILDRNPPQKFACTVFNHLGNTYYDLGQYAKADSLVGRALAIAESGNLEDPSDVGYIQSSLGRGSVLRKQYAAAEGMYRKAVRTFAGTLGSRHPDYALALTNLALVYQRQKRLREALPLLETAIDILEHSFGREAPILAETLNGYAEVIKGLGRKSEGRQIARRAKSIARPDPGTVDIRALSRKP